jgi:hypothetical protein
MASLKRSEFMALLPSGVQPNNFHQRTHQGLAIFASRGVDRGNVFHLLDPVALRLTEALATRITLKQAVQLTADTWPDWSHAVSLAERPGGDRDPIYLIVIDTDAPEPVVKFGPSAKILLSLSDETRTVHAISITRLLADLRADAEAAGIALPDKLAPAFGSPEWAVWRAEIDAEEMETAGAFAVERIRERALLEQLARTEAERKKLQAELLTISRKVRHESRDRLARDAALRRQKEELRRTGSPEDAAMLAEAERELERIEAERERGRQQVYERLCAKAKPAEDAP